MEPVDQVRQHLPEIYNYLMQQGHDYNWEEIASDFQELNWCILESSRYQEIVLGIFNIADQCGEADLRNQNRYPVLRLNRVRMFINSVAYELSKAREKAQSLNYLLRKHMISLMFFSDCKQILKNSEDDAIGQNFHEIHTTFSKIRNWISLSLAPLDSMLRSDLGKSLKDYLNQYFYDNVLLSVKQTLKLNPQTRELMDEYEKSSFSNNRGYNSGMNRGMGQWSSTPPYYGHGMMNTVRESIYLGETDQEKQRNGYGKITLYNGDMFEGYWENDKPHGQGIYRWRDGGVYEGEFYQGRIQGNGKRVYPSGNVYVGAFQDGKKTGRGEMRFKNGDRYAGEWDMDDMHGEGAYYWKSGDVFFGKFERDRREGRGTLTLASGEVYESNWKNGRMKTTSQNQEEEIKQNNSDQDGDEEQPQPEDSYLNV